MSLSFEQIVGACVAVIVAGMPAMVALLKIKELHLAVNSSLAAFVAATKAATDEQLAAVKQQSLERIAATKQQSDDRITELQRELEGLRHRNDQLLDQIAELGRRITDQPIVSKIAVESS